MKEYGLYMPDYFSHQHYDNYYDIPLEQHDNYYFVHIDYFRKLYGENKRIFNQITKELVFRGGEFFLEKESPLFPKIIFNDNKLITLENDIREDAFKHIDYDVYGIEQFVKMFNINNNQFFDHVPLEGFKVLNLSNISLLYLKKKFAKTGFIISEYDSKTIRKHKPYENMSKISGSGMSTTLNHEGVEKEQFSTEKNLNRKGSASPKALLSNETEYKISENVFKRLKKSVNDISENKFFEYIFIEELNINRETKEKFQSDGISILSQMNTDHMPYIINHLTSTEIKNLSTVLENVLLDYNLVASKIDLYINENPSLEEISIDFLVNESTYNRFKNNAYHLGLRFIGDFTVDKTIQLFSSKGVGKTKIFGFLNKLFSLNPDTESSKIRIIDSEEEKSVDEVPLYFAYGMIKNSKLRRFIKERKITFLSESELVDLVKTSLKKNKDKKRLIKYLNKAIKDLECNRYKNMELSQEFKLTIKDILDSLDIEYIFDQFNGEEILTEPIYSLADKYEDLPSEYKQIIHYYLQTIDYFNTLESSPIEVFNFGEREKIIFDLRINTNNKETLDSIADKIGGLTRERVRQIELKCKNIIKESLYINDINLYIKHLESNNIFKIDQVNFKNIFIALNLQMIYYNEFLDVAVHKKYSEPVLSLENKLKELTRTKDIFSLNELLNSLEEQKNGNNFFIVDLLYNNIYQYLTKLDFKVNENIVIKNKVSKAKIYTYIIEKYYSQEYLDFSDVDSLNLFINRLQLIAPEEMLSKLLNRNTSDLVRSIEAVLDRNNDKVLKIDAHQYKLLNIESLPYDLIDDMYKFVQEEILEYEFVAVKKVYWEFEKRIIRAGYTEKTVYNVLKMLFEDEFDFAGKTTLRIYEKGAERKTTNEIIISLLERNNGKLSIQAISKEMGVEEYTLYQHVENEYRLSNGIVYLNDSSSKLSETSISAIKNAFNKILMTKGYVPAKEVLNEVRFTGEVNADLMSNNYESLEGFVHLLKSLFPDIEGHTRILYEKDKAISTIEVLLSEIGCPDVIYRNDFFDTGKKLGFADVTVNMYLNDAIESGLIVPLNDDKFITKDQFKINDHQLESIDIFLKDQLDNNEYVSVTAISHELYMLPRINDYRWTPELLNHIAIHRLFYRKVAMIESQYHIDPLIITYAESSLGYRQLVSIIMKQFEGARTENNVLAHLIKHGLLRTNTRSIYKSFFNKKILKKNDFERIYLAEELTPHD